jgi:hypothetical protein
MEFVWSFLRVSWLDLSFNMRSAWGNVRAWVT